VEARPNPFAGSVAESCTASSCRCSLVGRERARALGCVRRRRPTRMQVAGAAASRGATELRDSRPGAALRPGLHDRATRARHGRRREGGRGASRVVERRSRRGPARRTGRRAETQLASVGASGSAARAWSSSIEASRQRGKAALRRHSPKATINEAETFPPRRRDPTGPTGWRER
jgi:hypothetical protein